MFGATKQVSSLSKVVELSLESWQMFQPVYTMLGHNWLDERGAEGIGYVRAVGTLFPRQLLNIMPDMQRIIRESFDTLLEEHKTPGGE